MEKFVLRQNNNISVLSIDIYAYDFWIWRRLFYEFHNFYGDVDCYLLLVSE